MNKYIGLICTTGLIVGMVAPAGAAETVSVEQFNQLKSSYNELKSNYDALKQEVQDLKKMVVQQNRPAPAPVAAAPQPAASQPTVTVAEFQNLKKEVKQMRPGISNFLVTGFGYADYTDSEDSTSSFTAGVNPIFLWKPSDNILFEAELEVSLEDGSTTTNLEYADARYLFNDYMTFVVGKFLSPFGTFLDKHPKWINKLPDKPYGYPDGAAQLVPESQIGAQLRGGIPLSDEARAKYALYISNGPTLQTDSAHAGELSYDNTNDNNNNKAFGGRVAFAPIPALEVGYSWEASRVGDKDTSYDGVNAFIQGVDLSFVRDIPKIKGTVNFQSEQIWSSVDSMDYGTSGGAFKNNRWARYVQLSYRPNHVDIPFLQNVEAVFRFDQIHHPSMAPTHVDHDRYTWGLDYWIKPNVVTKAAYEKDLQSEGGANNHTFLLETAVGF